MAEDATNDLMLTILRDLQEGQRRVENRIDLMDARFDSIEERFQAMEKLLNTNTTKMSGLAGITALAYGKHLKTKARKPAE